MCDNESSDGGAESQSPEEAEVAPEVGLEVEAGGEAGGEAGREAGEEGEGEVEGEAEGEQTTSQSDDSAVGALKSEDPNQEESKPSDAANGDTAHSPEPEEASDPSTEEAKPKPPPVPAPRVSFRSTDPRPLLSVAKSEKEETPSDQEDLDSGDNCSIHPPPGYLYKVSTSLLYLGSTALMSALMYYYYYYY